MFGIGKKDEGPQLVGAREKIRKAQAKAYGGVGEAIEGKSEGKADHGVLVVLIYILASSFAFVLMMGAMKTSSLDFQTGFASFDHIMFSGGVPSVLGNGDEDAIAVPLLRGLAIFAVWGFLPLLTLGWIKLSNKPRTNPYIAFWSVSLGFFLVFFLVKDCLLPLLRR